jgi:hypothetical protein
MHKTDIILISLTFVAAALVWMVNRFLLQAFNPRSSAKGFLLYLVTLLILVLGIIILFGFIVVRFRSYLFK